MNRLFKYIIFSPIWIYGQPLMAQQAFTLEQAVQYGIKNATSTRKDMLKITDAEQQIKAVRAGGFPQFSGSVEYQYFAEVPEMVIPNPTFSP